MFREMRRIKQLLPKEECEEILRNGKRGVLAVLGDDGYPYTVPLNYVYTDGKLYFHGAGEGHKIDALRNYPKASFCILDEGRQEEGEWWYHFRSVVVFGTVRILEDREEILRHVRILGEKYFPTQKHVEDEMASAGHRVCCLELTPEHMTGKHVREK